MTKLDVFVKRKKVCEELFLSVMLHVDECKHNL